MNYSPGLDAPIARRTMERVLKPFNIWFLFAMTMLSSCLFIAGMIDGGLNWLNHTTLPDSTLMLFLGIGSFTFFCPWFLCFYYCRILLRAVRDLEMKVESLSHDA
jgi:hypothetical protein